MTMEARALFHEKKKISKKEKNPAKRA